MTVDFGRTSADYGKHRRGFPQAFFEAIFARNVAQAGTRLLDLGAGTGALALVFAQQGARVTALDTSAEQLAMLELHAIEMKLEVEAVRASAEETGLESASFDLITVGQAWHWFDPVRAAQEMRRLLAPGGRVLLASFDWVPVCESIVARTEKLILAHNPNWKLGGRDGNHPEWQRDLERADFRVVETFYENCPATYSHEAWRGRIRASAGVAASLDPAAVMRFDAELRDLLHSEFPQDPLEVPHRFGFCIAHVL